MNTNPLNLEKITTFAATERLIKKLDKHAKDWDVSRSLVIRMLLYRGLAWMKHANGGEIQAELDWAKTEDGIVKDLEFKFRGQ